MLNNAIGLIETVGFAVGIVVTDAMVKSANVTLIGYEFAKGGGMTVIKIEGNVGAVNAAISAGKAVAGDKIYSAKVIPRPAKGLESMIYTDETVLAKEKVIEIEEKIIETKEIKAEKTEEVKVSKTVEKAESIKEKKEIKETEEKETPKVIEEEYTCNICKDSNCPRTKGELRTLCIKYKK